MVAFIKPIREKAAEITNNKALLSKVIKMGADKARANATETLRLVRKAMTFDYV